VGQCVALAALDDLQRTVAEDFLFLMPDPAWSECCAPARFGGKGLLQLTPIADLAAEANVRSSLKLALELCPSIVSSFPLLLPLIGFTGQCEDLQPKSPGAQAPARTLQQPFRTGGSCPQEAS